MGDDFDKRWIILAGFGLIAVVIVGVILISRSGGSSDNSTTAAKTTKTTAEGGKSGGPCKKVEAPEPKQESLKAPKQTVKKGEKLTVVMKTSCGTFDIALDTTRAPITSNSFAYLAEEGFYNDLTFHRIVPEFVIQGGDPTGTGTGGPGYSVDREATGKPPVHERRRRDGQELGRPARALRQPVLRRHRRRRRPAARIRVGRQGLQRASTSSKRSAKKARRKKNRNRPILIEEATVERG